MGRWIAGSARHSFGGGQFPQTPSNPPHLMELQRFDPIADGSEILIGESLLCLFGVQLEVLGD